MAFQAAVREHGEPVSLPSHPIEGSSSACGALPQSRIIFGSWCTSRPEDHFNLKHGGED